MLDDPEWLHEQYVTAGRSMQSIAEGEAEARRIMIALGVAEGDLIGGAYVDLLNDRA